jgi:hypothetical protein
MPKKPRKNSYDNTSLIIFFSAAALIGFFLINPFGFNLPWTQNVSPDQGNNPDNTATPNVGSNQILLTITPNVLNREEPAQVSVRSTLKNAVVQLQVLYVGVNQWQDFTTVTLDGNGNFNQNVPMNLAGVWKAKASYGAIESNVVDLTVHGLTLYQAKTVWNVGENYTASLTGTYHNWVVYIYIKNVTSNTWLFALNAPTDENGVIDPGTNSVPLTSTQINTDRNVIALICASDPTGAQFSSIFDMVQGITMTTDQQVDSLVNQGRLVKSNILTVSVR